MEELKRPVLGPMPRFLWLEERYEHLMQYVERCHLEGSEPGALYLRELREIARELKR